MKHKPGRISSVFPGSRRRPPPIPRPATAGLARFPVPRPVTPPAYARGAPCLPPLATRSGYTPRLSRRVLAYGRTRRANRYVAPSLSARSSPCPPRPVTAAAYAPAAPGHPHLRARGALRRGAYYAPGLSRAVLRKATARASPYADAVRRRIALNVSASVIGRRRFHLPRPLLVCRVPCADVRGSGSAPGDACPLRGFAERTAKTPTVPGARRAVAPFYESGDALHAVGLPRPFGDGGTRQTSTGPPRGRPHFAGRGRLRRPSRPSAFRRPAVALRAVERSPQGGSLYTRRAAPAMLFPPARFSPLHPPFRASPLQARNPAGGQTFLGGNSTAAFTARLAACGL